MNWRKEVLTGAHWHIKCALVKTPRLFFSSSTFSASESLPKKENRNKWTKTLLSQLLEKHPLHDVRWLWCTWQQLDIIVTTPITHIAKVTKASWCYLWKEQNLLHFLTINWCIWLVRQWLAGGWAAGLLHPIVFWGRVGFSLLYQPEFYCFGLLLKMRDISMQPYGLVVF